MSMGLTSFEFILLLPLVILIYYLLSTKTREYYLLLISLLFYACFGWEQLSVLVFEAAVAWLASGCIAKFFEEKAGKRAVTVVAISVMLLLSTLAFFRIGTRIIESIVAPLGVSFYTLQAISYVVDVSKREIAHERNYFRVLLYLSFFPTITSGPIYRYKDFVEENKKNTRELKADYQVITSGIIYVIYGYFLKLVIAERAAVPVNQVMDELNDVQYGGLILVLIAFLYSIQIYADFAGYSAIVIGIAQILGYKMPENFCAPYLARSIKDFWGRWHISLSKWLRDYVYIPLGGNRKGRFRQQINVMITFVVSGIWHGFGSHFLIWGILHAGYQIAGNLSAGLRRKALPYLGIVEDSFFHKALKRLITFSLVTFAWIVFRNGAKESCRYIMEIVRDPELKRLISGKLWDLYSPGTWIILGICILIMIMVDILSYKRRMRIDDFLNTQGALAKGTFVIIISLMILIWGVYGDQHDAAYFIYRDF